MTVTVSDNDGSNDAPVFTGGTTQARTLAETFGDARAATAAAIGGTVAADGREQRRADLLAGRHGRGQVRFRDHVDVVPDQDEGRRALRLRGEAELFGDGDGERRHGERDGRRDDQHREQQERNAAGAGCPHGDGDLGQHDQPGRTLDGAGEHRTPDDHGLRPALSRGDERRLDGRPAGCVGHEREYCRPDGGHRLRGTGARAVNTDGAGAWSGAGDGDTTPATPTVRFRASAYTAIKGLAGVVVTVQLDPAASSAVTVPVTATPQGGASSADYTGVGRGA